MFVLQILICPGIKKLSQPPRRRPTRTSPENVNFALLQSFLDYSEWLGLKNVYYPVIRLTSAVWLEIGIK